MSDISDVIYRIQLSDLDNDRKQEIIDKMYQATRDETTILHSVFEIPATWRFVGEIMKGAHVRIFDMGARYDAWKALPTASTRRSSHHSEGAQYHVNGPLVHTVLFGKVSNRTWFQLEGHPQGFGHVVDFFKYKFTGENQGPYGSSHYIDNRPIEIMPTTRWRVVDQHAEFR
jgi:hypothetical protein